MAHRHRLLLRGFAFVCAVAAPAWALIPGGRIRESDCLAEWRVGRASVGPTRGTRALDCEDGDPACDGDGAVNGSCLLNVSVCTLQRDPMIPECTAPPVLSAIRAGSVALALPDPSSESTCGPAMPVTATLRRVSVSRVELPGGLPDRIPRELRKALRRLHATRPAPSRRVRLRMTARAGAMRDSNRLELRCIPSATCPAPACPPSSMGPGEPNELALTMGGLGSDLDVGSSGAGHDFDVPLAMNVAASTVHLCLDGCTASSESQCSATLTTGAGTANGALFGPPRPVVVGGMALCIASEYAASAVTAGSANLATGAVDVTLPLRTSVYAGSGDDVCPRCDEGRCRGGANDGAACTVDTVFHAGGADDGVPVSRDCLPGGAPIASLSIDLPLTTGESRLADAACGVESSCDCSAKCTDDACAVELPDSVTGAFVCYDARGGVAQACCADDTTRPCFESPVARIGRATMPMPPWPDLTYPKASELVAGGTFCAAATENPPLDDLLGLPGPGAILLPAVAAWNVPTPSPCDDGGGGSPAPY